uniref:Uncharacterized protein n=1 Tax=Rhizophora mucronata TaxID=61149 RepID=A0A2P2PQ15_RHIMU
MKTVCNGAGKIKQRTEQLGTITLYRIPWKVARSIL